MIVEEILEITNKFKVIFSKFYEIWAISNYVGILTDLAKNVYFMMQMMGLMLNIMMNN